MKQVDIGFFEGSFHTTRKSICLLPVKGQRPCGIAFPPVLFRICQQRFQVFRFCGWDVYFAQCRPALLCGFFQRIFRIRSTNLQSNIPPRKAKTDNQGSKVTPVLYNFMNGSGEFFFKLFVLRCLILSCIRSIKRSFVLN